MTANFHRFYHDTGAKKAKIGVCVLDGTITTSIPRTHAVNPEPRTHETFSAACEHVINEINERIAELEAARDYMQSQKDLSELLGGEIPA